MRIGGLPFLNRRYTKLLKSDTHLRKLFFPFIRTSENMMVNTILKVTFLQKPNMKGWSMRICFPLGVCVCVVFLLVGRLENEKNVGPFWGQILKI